MVFKLVIDQLLFSLVMDESVFDLASKFEANP